ncbi:hypothetical protein FOZ61_005613 [Perkinsus olseni]|uniref:Uncharacterized protein n=1 Tax=Perkinsus olseni TaxID=32597 RepID=A0A7J6MB85_PEROL|nr:hypothetical protein FOZ61_005613 [Perkinsus olseni]
MSEVVVDGSGIRVEYDAEMDAIIMFGSLCMALATMGFVIYVHLSKEHAHSVYEDFAATGTTQLLLQDHSRATRLLESSSSIMPFRHWLAASVDRPNAVLDLPSSGEEDCGMEPDRCSCCSVCLSSYHTDDVVTESSPSSSQMDLPGPRPSMSPMPIPSDAHSDIPDHPYVIKQTSSAAPS